MGKFQSFFISFLVLAVAIRLLLSFLYAPHLHVGQQIRFTTTLLTEPTDKGSYKSITVQYVQGWGAQPLTLLLPPDSDFHYGQTMSIIGNVKERMLTTNKELFELSYPAITIADRQNSLLALSFLLRQKIEHLYSALLPEKSAALLLGIVLGVKANFSQNFLSNLQTTGVMHVIAASGMNVTMVSGFLLGFFTLLFKRQWAIALTILGLLFYCVLSGMQASILRATIMIIFALVAQGIGKQYFGLYGLLLAAGGMLLYNPLWIFDVGFQLSFAATLGILFFKPLLPKWSLFTDDIGTTLSAQIATVPILVGAFGSYGILSIVVNALVLWTVPPLMVLGGVGGMIGLVFAPVGGILILLCEPLLWFFESVVTYFGNFQWQVTITELPLVMILGYYLLLGSIVWMVSSFHSLQEGSLLREKN